MFLYWFLVQFLVFKAFLPVCRAPQRNLGTQMMLQEVQNSSRSFWNPVQRRNFSEVALIRTRKTQLLQKAKWQNFQRLISRQLRSRIRKEFLLAPIISLLGSNSGREKTPCDSLLLLSSLQILDLQILGSVKILPVGLFCPVMTLFARGVLVASVTYLMTIKTLAFGWFVHLILVRRTLVGYLVILSVLFNARRLGLLILGNWCSWMAVIVVLLVVKFLGYLGK